MMGDVHATIVVQQPKELTVENLCQRLLPYFAADHMDVSLKALNEEYAKMVARMEKEAVDKAAQPVAPPSAPPPRKPRVLLSATEALLAVGSENGCCNWLLLEPKALNLHGAGVGGLEEMQTHLAEDKVLFGILRLSFGGAFGLTKHVFVHWIGPRVGIVQRGLLNAKLASASALVNIHCSITFRREAHCLRDLDLENIISELRRLTVVDGVQGAASRISVQEYLSALEEEIRHVEQKAAEPEIEVTLPEPEQQALKAEPQDISMLPTEAIQEVKATSGSYNWVLIGWDKKVTGSRGGA
jgi:hypothetical protein